MGRNNKRDQKIVRNGKKNTKDVGFRGINGNFNNAFSDRIVDQRFAGSDSCCEGTFGQ